MSTVGIIANPAASKDIRRLVAQGRVVPDWEKVNTIRRALIGIQSTGVARVVAMPDSGNLCRRAADDASITIPVDLLPMSPLYNEGDTTRAAAMMADLGVGCLITLGGDGTNRAVAAATSRLPIVAISTGTNNIFPVMIEGTLAGIAAGLVATRQLGLQYAAIVSKTLQIRINGEYRDLALVDVAISRARYVATRAIWDLDTIHEVFLTRAEPAGIGLSSIGGRLHPLSLADIGGLRYHLTPPAGNAADTTAGRSDANAVVGNAANASAADRDAVAAAGRNAANATTADRYAVAAAGRNASAANAAGSELETETPPAPATTPVATVLAPVAPGMIAPAYIAHWELLSEGAPVTLERRHATIALDGERALTVTPDDIVEITLARNGPPVVQVPRALHRAAQLGLFHRAAPPLPDLPHNSAPGLPG